MADKDPEIAARARYLLQQISIDWTQAADSGRRSSSCWPITDWQDAQHASGTDARPGQPAGGQRRAGLVPPSLPRAFAPLIQQAAVELLGGEKPEAKPDKDLVEVLRRELAGSRRPAAAWLLTYARLGEDRGHPGLERPAGRGTGPGPARPHQSAPELIAALLKFHFNRLLSQRAWNNLNEAAERFALQIAPHPLLLYAVAEAQLAQGNKARAEQTAERAFRPSPNSRPTLRRASNR